jgi:hypothetical protein
MKNKIIPNSKSFDVKNYPWKKHIDYRIHPELYRVGKGEQGVLICEPYKSEILPFWKFKTPEIAQKSAEAIYELFLDYLNQNDFVGADMSRKFLQMGFTRSRRYTNYKGGRKYLPESKETFSKGSGDPIKAESASIYYFFWKKAENQLEYFAQKKQWKKVYG